LTGSPTLLNNTSLEAFAKKKGLTKAQAMYRLVQHWGIIPLAGSTNERHMKDGVEVKDVSLMDEEVPSDIYEYVWGGVRE
jgi:diketogulonate reductase-like aldo/keto reductase